LGIYALYRAFFSQDWSAMKTIAANLATKTIAHVIMFSINMAIGYLVFQFVIFLK
jgi:hypothetical protein